MAQRISAVCGGAISGLQCGESPAVAAGGLLARRVRSAKSTSASVLKRPRPKRRLLRAASSLRPRARSTWLGLGVGRRAGGAAADGEVAHRQEQGFAVDVAEGEVEVAGEAEGRAVVVACVEGGAAESDVVELVDRCPRRGGCGGRRGAAFRWAVRRGRVAARWRSRRCRAR